MDAPLIDPFELRWIKSLTHPTRVAILIRLLDGEDTTPATLAAMLGLSIGTVSYHVRYLHDARQIVLVKAVARRGAVAHHYRLSDRDATTAALRRVGVTVGMIPTGTSTPPGPPGPPAPWTKLQRAIGELRKRREAHGISREAVARQVGIKPAHLASIERGETDPRLTVLIEIADQLDTTLGEILTLTER